MSIRDAITNLQTDRLNIRLALADKGVTAAASHGFSSFAEDIRSIPEGFASIVVTAPTGSTITCNGETGTEISGTWTFSGLGIGAYTIVASKVISSQTYTSQYEQLIDIAGTYPITVTYSRLPDGYQEVEYIQSSGTQYIDTGIMMSTNCKSVVDLQFTDTTGGGRVEGFYYQNSSNQYFTCGWVANTDYNCYIYANPATYNGYTWMQTSFTLDTDRHTFIRDFVNWNYTLDGTVYSINHALRGSPSHSFPLFTGRSVNVLTGEDRIMDSYCSAKLYSAKYYDSTNALLRDFVPCYRTADNEVGLYDLVNSVLYTNQGTGVFEAGDPV